jgi:integrase/recombinase XerD
MDYLDAFIEYLQNNGKKALTLKSYRSDLIQFANWLQGIEDGEALTPSAMTQLHIAQYKAYMMNTLKRKPAGINRVLSALGAFCDWAQKQGWIEKNPVLAIHQTKAVKQSPHVLSEEELERLKKAVYQSGNLRDIALIELMIGAGLKLHEVEMLRRSDILVDDCKGMVTIRPQIGVKYRQIPLNQETRQALLAYLKSRSGDETELFISQKGGGLTANAIWKIVKKYGEAAGIDGLSPYTLRHTFGVNLVNKYKVDIITAAAIMGHENLLTTSNYCRTEKDGMQEAVEKLVETI